MFKLWEIPEKVEIIEEMLVNPETGEILSEEEASKLIEEIEIEKDKKVEFLCKLVKNKKAEAEMLKKHKQDIEKRIKSAEKTEESVKKYLSFALRGEKWKAEDASVSISYRNNKDVVKIDDVEALPSDCFKNPKVESNVSKTKVKELINAGIKVPGAHLEDSVSVIIK